MSQSYSIICPVSTHKVDENVVRSAAFITIIIAGISLFFNSYIASLLLAIDFGLTHIAANFHRIVKKGII